MYFRSLRLWQFSKSPTLAYSSTNMEFHNLKHDCRLPEATFVRWILNVLQKSVTEKNLSENICKQFHDRIMTNLGNKWRIILASSIFLKRGRGRLGIRHSGTSGNCVKYFWAHVKLSRINAKNYPICAFYRIQAWVFTKQLQWVCIWVDNCTITDNM